MSEQAERNKDTPFQSWFKSFSFHETGAIIISHPTLEEEHQINPPSMESERKHKCEECPYSTNRESRLKLHRITHMDVKPHQCPHCVENFTKISGLQSHLRHHTGELLAYCSICKASFSNLRTLYRHQGRWHTLETPGQQKINSPSQSERKHKCELCSYSTCRPSDLKDHILTHTVEMSYKCPYCPSIFAENRSFEYHLRNHKRLFSCSTCQATFPQKEILRRHERTHSENHYLCPTCWLDFIDLKTFKVHNCKN